MSTSDSNRPKPVKGAARSASKAARARTAKVGEAKIGGAIKGKAPEGKAPEGKALEGKAGKASAEQLRSPVEATSDADALLNSPDLTEPGTTPPSESPSIGDPGD